MVRFQIRPAFWSGALSRARHWFEGGTYFDLTVKQCGGYCMVMLVCDPTIIRGNKVFKKIIVNEDKNASAVFFHSY